MTRTATAARQQVEALLLELTGLTLEEWLRRTFFSRHVRQFKHRPIAWHLASTPSRDGPRRARSSASPAFQCLLYYHACRGDVLARLRAHYVEPLIRLETAAASDARSRGDDTAAALAASRVHELEEFAGRLREVEESAFACADLDRLLADEPLDRWSGDGIVAPATADELAAQERAWRVDINDGVRVNIAPSTRRPARVRRPPPRRRPQGYCRPRPLAIGRASLGPQRRPPSLRLDGRRHPREPALDRALARTRRGEAEIGGEASSVAGEVRGQGGLMRIPTAEHLRHDIALLSPDLTVAEALLKMKGKTFGVIVREDGAPLTCVSAEELTSTYWPWRSDRTLAEHTERWPKLCVLPESDAVDLVAVASFFRRELRKYTSVPGVVLVDKLGSPVGVLDWIR